MMSLNELFIISEWIFLIYFILLNTGYLSLNFISIFAITRYMNEQSISELPNGSSDVMPPITIIVPAYNEQQSIVSNIQALLQLDYPEFEIIVVNDGSQDETINVLVDKFNLVTFPEAYRDRLKTSQVKNFYRSRSHPQVRVVDKHNGGKSDALNTGINLSRYPLFCTIDADTILQTNSLKRLVQPFLQNSNTVASGGTIRIVNGCHVHHGFLYKAGLPENWLALLQIVEYLRAFLFGRLGWSPLNALLIISGALGLFRKENIIEAGGYKTDTVGEDMELITRLHHYLIRQKRSYRIVFVPDPICWTEAPEDIRLLARQRIRWQRGLAESLLNHITLLFNFRAGSVGLLAFPFMLVFELLGPFIEVFGFFMIALGFMLDYIVLDDFLMMVTIAIGFGVMLSLTALLLEEISFRIYPRPRDLFRLFIAAIVENFGFRQLVSLWRMIGLLKFIFRQRSEWGEMIRHAQWQKK